MNFVRLLGRNSWWFCVDTDPTRNQRIRFVLTVFGAIKFVRMYVHAVAEWWRAGLRCRKARVQTAVATLSDNSLRQTAHIHRASVHQAAKLVAALLRVAGVTAGLAESNGSLPLGL